MYCHCHLSLVVGDHHRSLMCEITNAPAADGWHHVPSAVFALIYEALPLMDRLTLSGVNWYSYHVATLPNVRTIKTVSSSHEYDYDHITRGRSWPTGSHYVHEHDHYLLSPEDTRNFSLRLAGLSRHSPKRLTIYRGAITSMTDRLLIQSMSSLRELSISSWPESQQTAMMNWLESLTQLTSLTLIGTLSTGSLVSLTSLRALEVGRLVPNTNFTELLPPSLTSLVNHGWESRYTRDDVERLLAALPKLNHIDVRHFNSDPRTNGMLPLIVKHPSLTSIQLQQSIPLETADNAAAAGAADDVEEADGDGEVKEKKLPHQTKLGISTHGYAGIVKLMKSFPSLTQLDWQANVWRSQGEAACTDDVHEALSAIVNNKSLIDVGIKLDYTDMTLLNALPMVGSTLRALELAHVPSWLSVSHVSPLNNLTGLTLLWNAPWVPHSHHVYWGQGDGGVRAWPKIWPNLLSLTLHATRTDDAMPFIHSLPPPPVYDKVTGKRYPLHLDFSNAASGMEWCRAGLRPTTASLRHASREHFDDHSRVFTTSYGVRLFPTTVTYGWRRSHHATCVTRAALTLERICQHHLCSNSPYILIFTFMIVVFSFIIQMIRSWSL
jgi:hypothetical protein